MKKRTTGSLRRKASMALAASSAVAASAAASQKSARSARTAEHPFNAGLMLESLVSQAQHALNSSNSHRRA